METNPLWAALLMTSLAGLSTGLGGLLVLWRTPGAREVSASLGFAAGVMLAVSLEDLLPAGLRYYSGVFSDFGAGCAAASLVAAGMAAAGLLGALLPDEGAMLAKLAANGGAARNTERAAQEATRRTPSINGGAAGNAEKAEQDNALRARALHCALAVGAALLLHNLPEGVLTLFSGVADPRLGLRMSLAIALHNIPEGISVSAPLWYATHSRVKSAGAAFASGFAEPAGAVLAYFLLRRFLTEGLLSGITLLVAGVMAWVSVAELLFSGFSMGKKLPAAAGFAVGVCGMTLGIALLA